MLVGLCPFLKHNWEFETVDSLCNFVQNKP